MSYETLERVLATVAAMPLPERDASYGEAVWQRVRPALRFQDQRRRWWSGLVPSWGHVPRWAIASAMAILVVAVFLAGRYWPAPPPQIADEAAGSIGSPQAGSTGSPQGGEVRERILLIAVGDHLERSQMVLVELVNAPHEGAIDMSTEQAVAQDLVSANRLYRRSAAESGEAAVVSVLDELERILLEISNSAPTLAAADREAIRERIEAQGILFKVRAIGSQMRDRQRSRS